jgi:putative transcriptional regulator
MSDALHEMRSLRTEAQACTALEAREAFAASTLVRRVRWHTGLSQEAFARAFHIDVGQLRAFERGELEPDTAVVAYLTVIDRDPELVQRALVAC